jgi:hypothetical protein
MQLSSSTACDGSGNGGGSGGSIERRNVPIDDGGCITWGRVIETAAFEAAVMVVLGRLFSWIHGVK